MIAHFRFVYRYPRNHSVHLIRLKPFSHWKRIEDKAQNPFPISRQTAHPEEADEVRELKFGRELNSGSSSYRFHRPSRVQKESLGGVGGVESCLELCSQTACGGI